MRAEIDLLGKSTKASKPQRGSLERHVYREKRRADARDFFRNPARCQRWLDFFGLEQSRVAVKLGLE